MPVGRMTELVSAVKQVRQNLPHTRDRFTRTTYRQMLVIEKQKRDLIDKAKKIKMALRGRSANNLHQRSVS